MESQAVFQAETQAKIVCIELGPRLLLMMMGELGNFVTQARTIEESDQVEIVVAAAVHFYLKISRTKEVRCPFARPLLLRLPSLRSLVIIYNVPRAMYSKNDIYEVARPFLQY